MKSQDLLLMLKLSCLNKLDDKDQARLGALYNVRTLADELGFSKSEVSNSLKRCKDIGLVATDRFTKVPKVSKKRLFKFIEHGVKYVFPVKPAEIVRGMPTTFAAPVLKGKLISAGDLIQVWPNAMGKYKGVAIKPLYRSVVHAAERDSELYALLALIDSILVGNAREVNLALNNLTERLFIG